MARQHRGHCGAHCGIFSLHARIWWLLVDGFDLSVHDIFQYGGSLASLYGPRCILQMRSKRRQLRSNLFVWGLLFSPVVMAYDFIDSAGGKWSWSSWGLGAAFADEPTTAGTL